MVLLPKDIRNTLPPLCSLQDDPDPVVSVRFHDTVNNWSWYPLEFDGDNLFYGLVDGMRRELGYFTLTDLLNCNGLAGFEQIRRDESFKPTRVKDIP